MPVRPISRIALADLIVQRVAERNRRRIAIDGPPPARPGEIADIVVENLRELGREALHVRTADFLRPASLRFELGRTNPDSYYERWVDLAALQREVLRDDGRALPTFWNPVTDRATRAGYVAADTVVVSGDLLLGAGLDFDLTVHLGMSIGALRRGTEEWSIPAYERYYAEVDPAGFADIVVRMNDPKHPALVI